MDPKYHSILFFFLDMKWNLKGRKKKQSGNLSNTLQSSDLASQKELSYHLQFWRWLEAIQQCVSDACKVSEALSLTVLACVEQSLRNGEVQMLTTGLSNKGSLWMEQERACALQAWQLYVEKPQLTGGKEEPGLAIKLPTYGWKSPETHLVQLLHGVEHKSWPGTRGLGHSNAWLESEHPISAVGTCCHSRASAEPSCHGCGNSRANKGISH